MICQYQSWKPTDEYDSSFSVYSYWLNLVTAPFQYKGRLSRYRYSFYKSRKYRMKYIFYTVSRGCDQNRCLKPISSDLDSIHDLPAWQLPGSIMHCAIDFEGNRSNETSNRNVSIYDIYKGISIVFVGLYSGFPLALFRLWCARCTFCHYAVNCESMEHIKYLLDIFCQGLCLRASLSSQLSLCHIWCMIPAYLFLICWSWEICTSSYNHHQIGNN